MPRKPRFFLPSVPAHLVQRGHARNAVFFENADCKEYLYRLNEAAIKFECALHAYALMTNHVHLLVTPAHRDSVSLLMQYLGRHYVPFINRKYDLSGTLWEGRFKASLVDEENYLLTCMRYIELNPVKAGMVDDPADHAWSSYRCNAQGRADGLLTPHPVYNQLGHTGATRTEAYQRLFEAHIDKKKEKKIDSAWMTGTPLGNNRFKKEIEQALGRKVGQNRRGRPTGFKPAKTSAETGRY